MDRVVPRYRRVAHGCHLLFRRVIHAAVGVGIGEGEIFYSNRVLGAASAILCAGIGQTPNSGIKPRCSEVICTQHRTAPPCLLRTGSHHDVSLAPSANRLFPNAEGQKQYCRT